MSQMPDSVYLHKDEKYNTIGLHSAYSENYILSENDYDESVLNDYVEYTPVYRLEEAVSFAKKDLALTWEDMKLVIAAEGSIYDEHHGCSDEVIEHYPTEEAFYSEVLKRFNKSKK